jgi:hypothetical protein
MKTVNFREIIIEDIRGEKVKADFQEVLGNQLYMQGRDIRECELGKKIYFAEGEIELSDDEANIVKESVKGWSYVARTAIEKMLDT